MIDTAANYPINKRAEDFGRAVSWLGDWIAVNGGEEISVLVKIGAVDNTGGPDTRLDVPSLVAAQHYYRERIGAGLGGLAVHWDNRSGDDDEDAIRETVTTFARVAATGLAVGFSGVKRPDLYHAAAPELADRWWIQVKENVASSTARSGYEKHFPDARYLAYGINMGGLKREPPQIRSSMALRGIDHPPGLVQRLAEFIDGDNGLVPRPENFNDLALLATYLNPALCGAIIGPRNVDQVANTLRRWETFRAVAQQSRLDGLAELLRETRGTNA